ncbi:MAG: hypothetical protein HPY66_3039 [Firmicutes bacterium]|nr:hypothetical protein [Bacillota bacterium]MDI6705171.1 hypothetical protein [Bacillota bacterium]
MSFQEDCQHDLLLIIATAVFILFATGLAAPVEIPGQTIVIPPA